jgi:predicted nucleic acid-binding protein
MVFVDTSAWYAYFVPLDPSHDRVREYLRSLEAPMATTDYCVDETLTLLIMRGEHRRALAAGKAFFEDDIARLQFLTVEQIQRAWILFQRRGPAGWSFTDCTSKMVIDDLSLREAASLDEHFQQFGIIIKP